MSLEGKLVKLDLMIIVEGSCVTTVAVLGR